MIGVLGGTFDPVHIGHLRMAIEAQEQYHLTAVKFIPCRLPVHKEAPKLGSFQRCDLLGIALQPHPNFHVETCEIDRDTPSYMVDTLKDLHARLPGEKFALLLGSDMVSGFSQWKDFKEILKLAEIIIMPRQLPVSSRLIRDLLNSGKNVQHLLPEHVLDYIQKHRLYINEKS